MTVPERVTLAEFLSGLDDASAAEARAAAARIDELARAGRALEGIESRFLAAAGVAAGMFVVGLWLFANPGSASPALTVVCLAGLPAVAVLYALRVMPRTRADRAAEDQNRRHFLPHGGLYFAAGENPACVVRVPPQRAGDRAGAKVTRKDIWW